MKKLFLTLLIATLCATGYGQTIKALGYNTTNNRVVGPTSTNALVFTNVTSFEVDAFFNGGDIRIGAGSLDFGGTERINLEENRFAGDWTFDQPASWRTNLGLGATWLTNDNVTNFRTAIGLGATNEVRFNEIDATSTFRVNDGSSTFVQIADDVAEFFIPVNILNANGLDFGGTNAAVARGQTRTNLGIPLPALTNTNNANFRTNIGLGAFLSEDGWAQLFDGNGNEILNVEDGVTVSREIYFDNATNAATTRTNLGLGGGIITNISVLVSGGGTNTLQFSNGILTNVTTP
jgi:hypothetical protein